MTYNVFLYLNEVGFISSQFNASESDSTIDITIGLLSGILRSEVEIGLSTVGLDAFGKALIEARTCIKFQFLLCDYYRWTGFFCNRVSTDTE